MKFLSQITINQGLVTQVVFSVIAPTDLPVSGVVPGGYTSPNLVIDQFGRITSAVNGTGGGAGTVSTVSVVMANGVSGSVANPTTTPALTIMLGAITPTSVAASGTVTGSNLSGTNTGDQTIPTLDAIPLAVGSVNLNTHKLTNVVDPTSAQDAATKNYVDTQISLQPTKQECQGATVAALAASTYANGSSGVGATITLTVAAVLILDGYTPGLNDRLLIKNQADATENGIYTLTTVGVALGAQAVLTRSTDFNQSSDGIEGAFVFVQNGTVNAKTGWLCSTFGSITFGHGGTSINWVQDTGSGTYTGTSPIAVSAANVISLGALTGLPTTGSFGVQDWLVEYNLISAINAKGTVELFLLALGRGYLDGFILGNNAVTPLTKLDFGTGQAADSTGVAILRGSGFTKDCNASWAAGTAGGNFLNTTLAASTWYHCFAIRKDSDLSVDFGIDTSLTAAHIPAGYTYYRRIGSIKTNASSQILAFHQYGDEFWWDTGVLDISVNPTSLSAVTRTLASVPTGLKVCAVTASNVFGTSVPAYFLLSSLDAVDVAPAYTGVISSAATSTAAIEAMHIDRTWTNTSAQIRSRLNTASATPLLQIRTLGWVDPRGKNQ
jgi:hypothetical protein